MVAALFDPAFRQGVRAGVRGIVVWRCEPPQPLVRRQFGSFASDCTARHGDMRAFASDVHVRLRDVVAA
jgi:hypothetical protein